MSEINTSEALKLGIDAHRAGNLKEAAHHYTAILKNEPNNPDASHNMGVLAVGIGKLDEAIPLFNKALEVNPKIYQFWISLIETLIKLNRHEEADRAVNQAKKFGFTANQISQLSERINKQGTRSKQKEPPQESLQPILNLYQQGQLQKALSKGKALIREYPYSAILYNLCGVYFLR